MIERNGNALMKELMKEELMDVEAIMDHAT